MHERCVNSLNISTSIQQGSTSTLACIVRTLRNCFSIRAIVIMIVIMEALKTGNRISLLCRRWISDTKTCSSSCYHPLHKLVSGWQIIRCFHCLSNSTSFYSIDSNLKKLPILLDGDGRTYGIRATIRDRLPLLEWFYLTQHSLLPSSINDA